MSPRQFHLALEDEQFECVSRIARARGCSIAAVIRDALTLRYNPDSEAALAAARRLLADDVLADREAPRRW